MVSFDVKGVRFGEGRPKTIVSLMGANRDELLAQAKRAVEAGTDCVEWRADFAHHVGDHNAMARTARALADTLPATPVVFTFRSAPQGGETELPAAEYVALVRAVVEEGAADMVDVEACAGDDAVRGLVAAAHERGLRAIVSHHDFLGTPDVAWMEAQLAHMAELGADLPKLAVMAHGANDCLRLMEATARARDALRQPVVTMAMGADGALSRLAGEVVGSALTFCALGAPSAPGQVGLAQTRALLDQLHDALFPQTSPPDGARTKTPSPQAPRRTGA